MFLAQSFKKYLKKTFQESKKSDQNLIEMMDEFQRDCGLDPDDTSNDPAFHQLSGNSWHFALGDN
jgi:hypothetical protein